MWRRRGARAAFAFGTLVVAAVATSTALAAFNRTATASQTVTTKRIFPTTTTLAPFDAGDASSGTESFAGSPVAFNDGVIYPALANFPTAYNAARYLDFQLNGPLPGGLAVSGLQLSFDLRSGTSGATKQTCFYVELRRTSTNALINTYGGSGSPIGCVTGNSTTTTTTTALSGVTTSDMANDLTVRAYVWTDTPARKAVVDRVVVTGSTPQRSFTLFPGSIVDLTGGSTTLPYEPVASDGAFWTSASSWATTFSATRYLRFAYPSYTPTGADVTTGSFTFAYTPTTAGRNACFYFAVYDGATLIATHGSSSTPVSCNNTATFSVSTTPLPEITTASRANNAVIRVYMSTNAVNTTRVDRSTLAVTYSLD